MEFPAFCAHRGDCIAISQGDPAVGYITEGVRRVPHLGTAEHQMWDVTGKIQTFNSSFHTIQGKEIIVKLL